MGRLGLLFLVLALIVGLSLLISYSPESSKKPTSVPRSSIITPEPEPEPDCDDPNWTCSSQREYSMCTDNLSDVDLTNAILTGVRSGGITGTPTMPSNYILQDGYIFGSNVNLAGDNLTSTNLTGVDLTESDLTGANLSGKNLSGITVTGAILSGTNLTKTILPTTNDVITITPNDLINLKAEFDFNNSGTVNIANVITMINKVLEN